MSELYSSIGNPCLQCGACCATYRVSFYWSEVTEGGLPNASVEQLNPWLSCMAGTNQSSPRCRGLEGEVGKEVFCTVYAGRPSPCHEVQPGDGKCNKARVRHGLAPLVLGWAVEGVTVVVGAGPGGPDGPLTPAAGVPGPEQTVGKERSGRGFFW